MRDIFTNPSFRAMLFSGVFSYAASGTSTALWAYMQPYYWGFDSLQVSGLLASQLVSGILAFLLMPRISDGRDKKPVLITISIVSP